RPRKICAVLLESPRRPELGEAVATAGGREHLSRRGERDARHGRRRDQTRTADRRTRLRIPKLNDSVPGAGREGPVWSERERVVDPLGLRAAIEVERALEPSRLCVVDTRSAEVLRRGEQLAVRRECDGVHPPALVAHSPEPPAGADVPNAHRPESVRDVFRRVVYVTSGDESAVG